jgi:hypothetical protein
MGKRPAGGIGWNENGLNTRVFARAASGERPCAHVYGERHSLQRAS